MKSVLLLSLKGFRFDNINTLVAMHQPKFFIISKIFLLTTSMWLIMSACGTDNKEDTYQSFNVKLSISGDPERLNPMLSTNNINRQVFQYIFLPLADFDADKLELTPILAKEIPVPTKISSGKNKGGLSYKYEIKPDAQWPDGTAITAKDYEFTVKAVMHPEVEAGAWRNYLSEIVDINLDTINERAFEVVVGREYILSTELTSTIQLYPAHIYDPTDALSNISLEQLRDADLYQEVVSKDSTITAFASQMNSNKYSREVVMGAGPYQLKDWVTNEYILLEKVPNYWGDRYPEIKALNGFAERLEIQIIPDNTTALSLLKSGEIDILSGVGASEFKDMQGEAKYDSLFNFLTPQLMRYFYLLLNDRDPKFKNKKVRRALAHLVDVDAIINALEYGNAEPTVGHIHPSKPYYNNKLKPISFDIEKSKEILQQEGWVDTNNDGSVDKKLNGKKVELEIDFLITGSALSKNIALIVQQSAKDAGVKVNIITKENKLIVQENIKPRDFDMYASASVSDASADDPYSKWHTDLADPFESNDSGFGTPRSDQLLEQIRITTDPQKRLPLYLELQEIMYDEQPVIFLYTPKERIIVNKRFDAQASSKRPGYFANTFKLK